LFLLERFFCSILVIFEGFYLQKAAAWRGRVLQPCNWLPRLAGRLCSLAICSRAKREAFAALQSVAASRGKVLQGGAGLPPKCDRFGGERGRWVKNVLIETLI
jgi:hypothetical protein